MEISQHPRFEVSELPDLKWQIGRRAISHERSVISVFLCIKVEINKSRL